jgi:hypothetical protein
LGFELKETTVEVCEQCVSSLRAVCEQFVSTNWRSEVAAIVKKYGFTKELMKFVKLRYAVRIF